MTNYKVELCKQLRMFTTTQTKNLLPIKITPKIKQTANFPTYLINEINPLLKNKYKIKKQLTRFQQTIHQNALSFINTKKTSLIIESENEQIITQIHETVRFIEHHTAFFHLSIARTISPTFRPSISIFRKNWKHKKELSKIAKRYDCYLWYLENDNKFGLFCTDYYKLMCCMQQIRIYIENNRDSLEYVQCDEIYKLLYFRNSNQSFADLVKHCDDEFGVDSYIIEQRCCDRGSVWIWSENAECRNYIKKYIETDIKHNWIHRYIDIEDYKISILFGGPHNNCNNVQNGKRINQFWRLFGYDDETKLYVFMDEHGGKCLFDYNYTPKPNKTKHQICIIVNKMHYDNMQHAKRSMEDIQNIIVGCDKNCIEWNVGKPYLHILSRSYMDLIANDILYGEEGDKIYMKYDDNESMESFKTLIYDKIVANAIIVDDFECFSDAHIFHTIVKNEFDDILFIQPVKNIDDDGFIVVIYDEKFNELGYKQSVSDFVQDIKINALQQYVLDNNRYLHMIYGPNAKQLHALWEHCKLNDIDLRLIHRDFDTHRIYIGLHKTDERLKQFFSIFDVIVSNCVEIKLSAEQWQFCRKNNSWNIKKLETMFKCCLSLNVQNCNSLLLYASERDKTCILNKIMSLEL